jgi:hypothetical protein
MMAQLIDKGSLFRKAFPAGAGSAKNIAFGLLGTWRNWRVSADQIQQMVAICLQIRFTPHLAHVFLVPVRGPLPIQPLSCRTASLAKAGQLFRASTP